MNISTNQPIKVPDSRKIRQRLRAALLVNTLVIEKTAEIDYTGRDLNEVSVIFQDFAA